MHGNVSAPSNRHGMGRESTSASDASEVKARRAAVEESDSARGPQIGRPPGLEPTNSVIDNVD